MCLSDRRGGGDCGSGHGVNGKKSVRSGMFAERKRQTLMIKRPFERDEKQTLEPDFKAQQRQQRQQS